MHRLRRSGIAVALAALSCVPVAGALAWPTPAARASTFTASLEAWPHKVLVGDKLYLDGSTTSHKFRLVDFKWDLGSGHFSRDTKDIPTTSTAFGSIGVKTVRVQIRNTAGQVAVASAKVDVVKKF